MDSSLLQRLAIVALLMILAAPWPPLYVLVPLYLLGEWRDDRRARLALERAIYGPASVRSDAEALGW